MPPVTKEQIAAKQDAAAAVAEAVAIMARLRAPGGCPWDREQTLDTIKPHTLEEVYEVFDAIDRRDWPGLQEELGDLLLQVLFYAQIAQDEKHFDLAAVARSLSTKLVRRHPHVFGDARADTAADVVTTWDEVKRQEKAAALEERGPGLLHSVSSAMPAFTEARKLGKIAASVGFDWPNPDGLFDKLAEEVSELRAELRPDATVKQERIEEEFGDLLFVLANLARRVKVDPEQALRKANSKFRRRFGRMESFAAGEALASHTPEALEDLWLDAKREERA